MKTHSLLLIASLLALALFGVQAATSQQTIDGIFTLSRCLDGSDPAVSRACQSAGSLSKATIPSIHAEVGLQAYNSSGSPIPSGAVLPPNTALTLQYSGKGLWSSSGFFTKYLSDSDFNNISWYELGSPTQLLLIPDSTLLPTPPTPMYYTCNDDNNVQHINFLKISTFGGMLVCKNSGSVLKNGFAFPGFPQSPTPNSASGTWSGSVSDALTNATTYSAQYKLPVCSLYIKFNKDDSALENCNTDGTTCYIKITRGSPPACRSSAPGPQLQMYRLYPSSNIGIDTLTQADNVAFPPPHENLPPLAVFTCTSQLAASRHDVFAPYEPVECDGSASSDPDGDTITDYSWKAPDALPNSSSGPTTDISFPNPKTSTPVTLTVTTGIDGKNDSTTNNYNVQPAACTINTVTTIITGGNVPHDTYSLTFGYVYPIASTSSLAAVCTGSAGTGTVESSSCAPNNDQRSGSCTVTCTYPTANQERNVTASLNVGPGGRSIACANNAGGSPPNNLPPVPDFTCASTIDPGRTDGFAQYEPVKCDGGPSSDPDGDPIVNYTWTVPDALPNPIPPSSTPTVDILFPNPETNTPVNLTVATGDGKNDSTRHEYDVLPASCVIGNASTVITGANQPHDTYTIAYSYVYPFATSANLLAVCNGAVEGGTLESTSCTPLADPRNGFCAVTCKYDTGNQSRNLSASFAVGPGSRTVLCTSGPNATLNASIPINVDFTCASRLDSNRTDNFAVDEPTACNATSLTFDPNPGQNISTYTWDTSGIINTAAGPLANISYPLSGTQVVLLNATSTSGASGTTAHDYVVNPKQCTITLVGTNVDVATIVDTYSLGYGYLYPLLSGPGDFSVTCNSANGFGIPSVTTCNPDSGDARAGQCTATCTYPAVASTRTMSATLRGTVVCTNSTTLPHDLGCFQFV